MPDICKFPGIDELSAALICPNTFSSLKFLTISQSALGLLSKLVRASSLAVQLYIKKTQPRIKQSLFPTFFCIIKDNMHNTIQIRPQYMFSASYTREILRNGRKPLSTPAIE